MSARRVFARAPDGALVFARVVARLCEGGLRLLLLLLVLGFQVARVRAQEAVPASRYQSGLVLTLPAVQLPEPLAQREAQLQSDFSAMRAEARGRDWLLGGMVAVSATLIAFGSAYPRQVGALLLPLGSLGLVRGFVGFALLPDPRLAAGAYLRMPMFSLEQARARIQFGERALAEQARVERRARIIDGVLSFAVASSYVPVSFVISRRHDPDYRFRDDGYGYAYLAFSVVGAATVLVSALSQTVNEQRARAYRELVVRQDLEPGRKPDARRSAPHRPADRLSWGLCGTRQRLELSTAFRF